MILEGLVKGSVHVEELEEEERPLPMPPPDPPPPPEEPKKKGFWNKVLDVVQIGLDVVGAIPGVGIAANVVNAGISMARGDKLGAGLSLVACIPFAGPLVKGAKMAKAIGKAVPGLAKGAGKVMNTVQKARNIAQTVFQEVLSVVKPLKGK